jgi:hypothetical protein
MGTRMATHPTLIHLGAGIMVILMAMKLLGAGIMVILMAMKLLEAMPTAISHNGSTVEIPSLTPTPATVLAFRLSLATFSLASIEHPRRRVSRTQHLSA